MRSTKKMLILGCVLIALGVGLFAGAIGLNDWKIEGLDGEVYNMNKFEINEGFESVVINTDTADIAIMPSENGNCIVECRDLTKITHTAEVKNGVLEIRVVDERKWYEKLISFASPGIKVYLPDAEYKGLKIDEATGDVDIEGGLTFKDINIDLSTGDVKMDTTFADNVNIDVTTGDVWLKELFCNNKLCINVTTGDTELSNVKCLELESDGSTGEIEMNHVIAYNNMFLKRTTGDIDLKQCDADTLSIQSTTGSVHGTLLSEKIFDADATTGSVHVPNTKNGGVCKIRTTTGSIWFSYVND
ncbi:MAG: DUF4097 domain-containing protein [Clostridiales bacterium]|nr:DUF4097 domain-containing protein [Clostridiales bacterium]